MKSSAIAMGQGTQSINNRFFKVPLEKVGTLVFFYAIKSRLRCLQHIDTKQKILKPKKRLPHKIHRKPVTELAFALPR